jgi:hypothetical protein
MKDGVGVFLCGTGRVLGMHKFEDVATFDIVVSVTEDLLGLRVYVEDDTGSAKKCQYLGDVFDN